MYRAKDRVDKTRSIEIYNAIDFLRMRQHWNGCGLLFHEYCHLIHQQVLGLQNRRVYDIYQQYMMAKGNENDTNHHNHPNHKYARVLRRDWVGLPVDYDVHYATVNVKEFFAEMSVTYWSRGYPELDNDTVAVAATVVPSIASDTTTITPPLPLRMEDCSPPLMEPTVRKRVLSTTTNSSSSSSSSSTSRLLESVVVMTTPGTKRGYVPHCNKFFPFTAGQLRHYDPELYARMDALWTSIASWTDDEKDNDNEEKEEICCCWTPPGPLRWWWQHMAKERDHTANMLLVTPPPPPTTNSTTPPISDTVSL
jgi:hypothetical protein